MGGGAGGASQGCAEVSVFNPRALCHFTPKTWPPPLCVTSLPRHSHVWCSCCQNKHTSSTVRERNCEGPRKQERPPPSPVSISIHKLSPSWVLLEGGKPGASGTSPWRIIHQCQSGATLPLTRSWWPPCSRSLNRHTRFFVRGEDGTGSSLFWLRQPQIALWSEGTWLSLNSSSSSLNINASWHLKCCPAANFSLCFSNKGN